MSSVECVLKIRSILGEGPLWDEAEKRLYWLDLRKPAIYCFDPATGRNVKVKASLRGYIGGMVLRAKGGMMALDQRDPRGVHTFFTATNCLDTRCDAVQAFDDGGNPIPSNAPSPTDVFSSLVRAG